jgi:hypothetical protein
MLSRLSAAAITTPDPAEFGAPRTERARLPVEVDTALAAARARRRDIFAMRAAASPPPARNETRLLEQRFWFVVAGLQHILASLLPCYEQQIDSILKVEYSFWWTMYEISCCKPVNAVR